MMADDNENVKNTARGLLGLTTTICTWYCLFTFNVRLRYKIS